MVLGHLVQVWHLVFVLAVMYALTRMNNLWILLFFGGLIIVSNLANEGMCPLTVLSNTLLKNAGGEGYPSLVAWLENFIGTPANYILYYFSVGISLLAGYMVRTKKERATCLT